MSENRRQRVARLRSAMIFEGRQIQYVYLISDGNGAYKIGRTNDLTRRVKLLQSGNSLTLSVVHAFTSPDATKIETSLHKLFADVRIRGEWFDLSEDDAKFVATLNQYNYTEEIINYAALHKKPNIRVIARRLGKD